MRHPIHVMWALLLTIVPVAEVNAASPVTSLCEGKIYPSLEPIGVGPLTLAKIQCLELPDDLSNGAWPPTPSPDGKSYFTFDNNTGLWLGSVTSKVPLQHFDVHASLLGAFDFDRPFMWLSDARSVLGARQDMMRPRGGWALGPLKPFLVSMDGKDVSLTPLSSPAGPLDEVHWVGHAGLAIALFGAKGDYYRPVHADPRPTIAFVNARTGQVIQSVPLADLVPDPKKTHISNVASRSDQRGRTHALITLAPDRWMLWSEGEKPRMLPLEINLWAKLIALSPDGQTVLIMQGLSAKGVICEQNPRCPRPTPSTGVIAELRSLRSGGVIWSLTGTAETFSNDGEPAISPDGRYALISMPTGKIVGPNGYRRPTTALIAMATGKLLQEIPSPQPLRSFRGFSADSKNVWISGDRRIVTYRIGR